MKRIDLKKMLTGLTVLLIIGMTPVSEAFGQTAEKTGKTVQLKIAGKSVTVEAGKIGRSDSGFPKLTIFSEAISGGVSMSAAGMFPVVACAKLKDGTVLDPITLGGGVEGESGYSSEGNRKTLLKTPPSNKDSGASWKPSGNGKRGYLVYGFDTKQPIADIIVGSYDNYCSGNYKAFVSTGQKFDGNKN